MGKSFKGNGGDKFSNRVRLTNHELGNELPQAEGNFRPPMADRPPLQWDELETLVVGMATATISSAKGDRGTLYSFSIGRAGREPGRTSKFFQPRDVQDLEHLLEKLALWLAAASSKAEQQA